MRKLAFIGFLSVAVAATNQIVIRPLLRGPSSPKLLKTARAPYAASGQGPDSGPVISGPVSGYVADPRGRGIRPVLGIRAYAFVGDLVDFGEDVASIVSSPNQDYVVETDAAGTASLWIPLAGSLAQQPFPADVSLSSSVVLSPQGFSAAVVSNTRGAVQLFSSLPSEPAVVASLSFSDLGGPPHSIAVSDDGTMMLFTLSTDRRDCVYAWWKGSVVRVAVESARISSLAFAQNSHDAVIADGGNNQVLLVRSLGGVFAPVLVAGQSVGIAQPVAAEFARDGRIVVVANRDSKTIQVFGTDGTPASSATCNCDLRHLRRLTGNAVFQLTEFDGASMVLFDGDAQPAATALIAPLQPAAQPAPAVAGPSPAASFVTATVSNSVPSSTTCAAPGGENAYYLPTSTIYPWITLNLRPRIRFRPEFIKALPLKAPCDPVERQGH